MLNANWKNNCLVISFVANAVRMDGIGKEGKRGNCFLQTALAFTMIRLGNVK